ncbi:hypothetical protein FRB99_001730 [Tulasnella sp. 403]|nr:hypothetical protein FRB99_001730 [Tulasnella sp. 403]
MSLATMWRSFQAVVRAPLIPPQPPYPIVPLATFKTYAPQERPQDPQRPNPKEKISSKNEEGAAGAPSTDEIAHSDAAYSGSGPNPDESAKRLEQEKRGPGMMRQTAANPHASKPPKEASQ